MKKSLKIAIISFTTIYLYSSEFFSSYGISLGDGFYSYSLGAESVIYNSAAAIVSYNPELILEYEDLLSGIRGEININRQVFCGIYPYRPNDLVFGSGLFMFNSDIYKELFYKFTLSKNITEYVIIEEKKKESILISAGLNLKYMNFSYPKSSLLDEDPIFSLSREKNVFSFDINLFYTLNKIYFFGLSINDIFEPNIGLKDESILTRKTILSFCYRYLTKNYVIIPLIGLRNYLNITEFSFGCEVIYKQNYKIRASYSNYSTAVGIGYEYKYLSVNYSYVFLNKLDTSSGHYISLCYRIDNKKDEVKQKTTTEIKTQQMTPQQKNVEIKKTSTQEELQKEVQQKKK